MISLGYLREKINGSTVHQLKSGWCGYFWDNFFSTCPFLGIVKNVFFNDFIKAKGLYVNNGWFLGCAYWEFFILDTLDGFLPPNLIPTFLDDICQR